MNPQLENLLIWFLELGQLYIILYGLLGLIVVGIGAIMFIKDQEWGMSISKVFPLFLMPIIFRLLFNNMDLVGVIPEMLILEKYIDLFYLVPILLIGISIWEDT